MKIDKLAGIPAPPEILADIPRLVSAYYLHEPDPNQLSEKVSFGTSGHRGTSFENSFNEMHIQAICQAIVDYRRSAGIEGPLFIGKDTHALSESAHATAVEVFSGNNVEIYIQDRNGYTPTPVISHAILTYNHEHPSSIADGVVITPSHNPPEDGGFKYNPPSGGPANTETTQIIQNRANEILSKGNREVNLIPYARAMKADTTKLFDFLVPYVKDLDNVIDMGAISSSGLKVGVDPMGGAGLNYWEPIADHFQIDIKVVNRRIDPSFSFMTVDKDGKVRMDCSSPYAMARLIELKEQFHIAFGNDPDTDRHGIVTKTNGLMNPNHYLAVSVWYLFRHRPEWQKGAAVGKTLVSSSMIDRVAANLGRKLTEVPVGFKWFVDGLLTGSLGFGGEESAGASYLRKNGTVWTTDKDGFILNLLAAEITAVTGRDPAEHYKFLEDKFGSPVYERLDVPATKRQKEALKDLNPKIVETDMLAGEKIMAKITRAPANNAPIGGLKVVTKNGWFAARPSGTEDIYKIYAESFIGEDHLQKIKEEAQSIVEKVFRDIQ